jgi:hypothetical protein
MKRRTCLVTSIAICLASRGALGQGPTNTSSAIGIWRGTSLCLVRPSSCNDEVVVYRIERVGPSDSASIDARKIVNGVEQEMGVLRCRLTASVPQLRCTIPNGVWQFTTRGDSLIGELRLRDNTKFRDVRAARAGR